MDALTRKKVISEIFGKSDSAGCWNRLEEKDKYYPVYNYYVPNYNSTLWTLVLLADMGCGHDERIYKPFRLMSDHFREKDLNIYSIGKSHFPIPCLNGNMLYLHHSFKIEDPAMTEGIVDFFSEYQRFDDGDFKTPKAFPYCSNRSCYGKHSCYWGVTKLLKGLSFIPENQRSENAVKLIGKCIDFVLLHNVCFSSRNSENFIQTNIQKLTFPNMYQSDFLEILILLKREKVKSVRMTKALNLLKNKMRPDGTWKIERLLKNLIVPMGNRNSGYQFLSERAQNVMDFYSSF